MAAPLGIEFSDGSFWGAVTIGFLASLTAAGWPWLQSQQRRLRFQRLIRRELEEVGPYPKQRNDQPWWTHLGKRFVHEEVFKETNVTANRDFLLSLHPSVTYQVSQLWIAFEKQDGLQWQHFLHELANNRRVNSPKLSEAARDWTALLGVATESDEQGLLRRTHVRNANDRPSAEMFNARLTAYASLLPLTRNPETRAGVELEAALNRWFYSSGNGLLLSGDSFRSFQQLRKDLTSPKSWPDQISSDASALRTELKIDLGVRHPDERYIELARPVDRGRK